MGLLRRIKYSVLPDDRILVQFYDADKDGNEAPEPATSISFQRDVAERVGSFLVMVARNEIDLPKAENHDDQ